MKPLIFRIDAKDEGVEATLDKILEGAKQAGGKLEDSFRRASAETEKLSKSAEGTRAAFQAIKPPASLEKTDNLFKKIRATADKAGKDIRSAFAEADRGSEPLSKGLEDLRQEFRKMGQEAKQSLQSPVSKSFNYLKDQIAKTIAKTKELKEELKSTLSAPGPLKGALDRLADADGLDRASGLLQGLADSSRRVYDGFAAAEESSRELERNIRRAFADPGQAEKWIKAAKDLKNEYQGIFSGEQITESISALNRFGVASEQNLKRVAALAAANPDLSLSQVSETYAEFRKKASGGKHDFGSTEQLRSQLGIDPAELVKFGAEVDKNNKLLGDTADQATKAQKALDAYIDSQDRYKGVAERAADGQSKLSAEMSKFQGSIGQILNDWKNWVAEGMTPAVQVLNEMPGIAKTAFAGLSAATPVIAGVGASALQMAAYAQLAGINVASLGVAAKATLTGPLGIVVAATAAATAIYTIASAAKSAQDAWGQAEYAQRQLMETQGKAVADARRLKYFDQNAGDIIKEVQAEKDAAKARVEITNALIAKKAQFEAAEKSGRKEDEERFHKEVVELQQWRNHMDTGTAADLQALKSIDDAREANYQRGVERYNAMQKLASRGLYDSKADELAALNSIVPALAPGSDVAQEAEGKRKQLTRDAAKERINNLKQEFAEEKALREVSLDEELANLRAQLEIAKSLDKQGAEERIRIYKEMAATKAKVQAEADKKLKDQTLEALKEASRVGVNTKTYDRGTGRAVDAYDKAIERVKSWQSENVKLINKFPELGQKGKAAIEQLRLAKATADVARMSKNFQDLKREIKKAGDEAVTTADKIAANEKALKDIKKSEVGGKISKEQAEQLRGEVGEDDQDDRRRKQQEDIQHRQQMASLAERAAQQELAIAESIADGTIQSQDRIKLATEKLYQFKLQALKDERDAAIAGNQDKVQAEERYQAAVANLERQRTADWHAQAKARVDAKRQELQQIIDLDKSQGDKGKTQVSFGLSDNANWFSFDASPEAYKTRKDARRAKAELDVLNRQDLFRKLNPEIAAQTAEEERQKALRAIDPTGVIRDAKAKMTPQTGAGGTVNNNNISVTVNTTESRKTRNVESPGQALREVERALTVNQIYDPKAGLS